jgi:hypothetical protein
MIYYCCRHLQISICHNCVSLKSASDGPVDFCGFIHIFYPFSSQTCIFSPVRRFPSQHSIWAFDILHSYKYLYYADCLLIYHLPFFLWFHSLCKNLVYNVPCPDHIHTSSKTQFRGIYPGSFPFANLTKQRRKYIWALLLSYIVHTLFFALSNFIVSHDWIYTSNCISLYFLCSLCLYCL